MSDRGLVILGDDGTWEYRLSGWGACIRNLVAARKGITPMPEELDTVLGEGHLHEGDVIARLGRSPDDRQARVVLDLDGGRIVGHLDALNAESVLEVKALGKATFAQAESLGVKGYVEGNATYAWQISGAMISTGLPAHYAIKSRDSGKIIEDWIEEPFKTIEDFQKRLDEIEQWVAVDRLPPCEKTGFCWKGPYRHVHYKEDEPKQPIPMEDATGTAIEDLAAKLYDTRLQKKACETLEDDLKKELLSIAGPGQYETEMHKVKVTEVASKRMDQAAVRAEHGDKYDKESSYMKVTVDPKG